MTDPFRPVSAGEVVIQSAAFHNATLEAIQHARSAARTGAAGADALPSGTWEAVLAEDLARGGQAEMNLQTHNGEGWLTLEGGLTVHDRSRIPSGKRLPEGAAIAVHRSGVRWILDGYDCEDLLDL